MAQTDREILVHLYNVTDGPNWSNKTEWCSGAALSDWYGVKANGQGRVVKLSLSKNGLKGTKAYPTDNDCCSLAMSLTFPKNFFTERDPFIKLQVLQEATTLSFWLGGRIPAQLGNLAALQYLHLDENTLSELEQLYLWGNQLSGRIPPELGNLAALTVLHFWNNQLIGNIPNELGRLSALTYLNLGTNRLEGPIPRELGELRQLKGLWLPINKLTGLAGNKKMPG
ncbi:unnamed protein product [Ectocarpus sp. CCAP 1310/34]|nr:unnamed protein product [Ectocarpus sp. CCAP 1310/34]